MTVVATPVVVAVMVIAAVIPVEVAVATEAAMDIVAEVAAADTEVVPRVTEVMALHPVADMAEAVVDSIMVAWDLNFVKLISKKHP